MMSSQTQYIPAGPFGYRSPIAGVELFFVCQPQGWTDLFAPGDPFVAQVSALRAYDKRMGMAKAVGQWRN